MLLCWRNMAQRFGYTTATIRERWFDLKAVKQGKQMKAVMVLYANDFVVLCRKGQRRPEESIAKTLPPRLPRRVQDKVRKESSR